MILVRPIDLGLLHPRLLWTEIAAALSIAVEQPTQASAKSFSLSVQDVPAFGSADLELHFDLRGFASGQLASMQRTYDSARIVELAAIGIAGIGLHLTGGHEIRDVALRGSGADYLVDDANHLLEVSGRSRRADFQAAWRERHERLSNRTLMGYYVCVSEFETLSGKLAFFIE